MPITITKEQSMPNRVAKERLYLTYDGSRVVREGDPEAASLFVAKGLEVTDADVKKYGLSKLVTGGSESYDAVADHETKHGGETEAQAEAKHQAMLDGETDPDGEPAEGERGDLKAKDAPPTTKARTKAPATKDAPSPAEGESDTEPTDEQGR